MVTWDQFIQLLIFVSTLCGLVVPLHVSNASKMNRILRSLERHDKRVRRVSKRLSHLEREHAKSLKPPAFA